MTTENWTTVLNLAHNWKFHEVKALAIRELQKVELDTVSRMALYQNNGVDIKYILPLYADLCAREEIPTQRESEQLGMNTIIKVFQAREMLRSRARTGVVPGQDPSPRSPLPNEVPRKSIVEMLGSMLGIEPDIDDTSGTPSNAGAAGPSSPGHSSAGNASANATRQGTQATNVNGTASSSNPRPPPTGKWQPGRSNK